MMILLSSITFTSLKAQVPTWSAATAPGGVTEILDGVAYNGSKFIAVGNDLRVLSSTDGINWTNNGRMAAPTVVNAFGVAWVPFLNLWVAGTNVGLNSDALLYTSSDGVTWTQRSAGLTSGTAQAFATDGTKVIGTVSSNVGQVVKSTNGTTWSIQSVGVITSSLFDIIYAGGQFVAVGGSGGIITSPDGNTWTKRTAPSNIPGIIRSVAYGNGRYVLVANSAGFAGWSTDGFTWNNSSTGLATGLTKLTFVNGVFVGVGPSGTISTSTDGVTWTAAHTSGTTENFRDIIANGTGSTARVVAVGGDTTTVLRHILASDLNPSVSVAPTVTTATQSAVTHNSATLGGNVTADGGATVTDRGIVWGTSANPTITNNKVQIGSGTGIFSSTVNGLPSNTLVYVRAYATNSVNTSYGSEISFTTLPAPVAVSSLSTAASSPTNASSVSWTLSFASAVTGITASNFSLTNGVATGSTIGTPTTSDNITWTIPVTTGSTDGTITLNLANASGLTPAISSTLPYAGSSVTIDKTPPTVLSVVRQTPTGQNTSAASVTFRVTYSEPVTLDPPQASHFSILPVNGGTVTGTISSVTGTGNTRDVTVNITGGTGEFRLRVID